MIKGRTFLFVLGFFCLLVFPSFGQEGAPWIEPGVGVSGIRIGDDEAMVVGKLGTPERVSGTQAVYYLDYPYIRVTMSRLHYLQKNLEAIIRGKEPKEPTDISKLPGQVIGIVCYYGQRAKTRGDISVGSSLVAVLKVFGDTMYRRMEPFKFVDCSFARIEKVPERENEELRWNDFDGYVLLLNYVNEGLSFTFKLGDSPPAVYAITVRQRGECKPIFDLDRKTK